MNSFMYIANWKMQVSFNQASLLAKEYIPLVTLLKKRGSQMVMCPSFPSLHTIQTIIKDLDELMLGAQDCSPHAKGAFTGQVSAQSLAEVGCAYCIVGHSESRNSYHTTNDTIAQKALELFKNSITPIFCIGETRQERAQGNTMHVVKEQLEPLFKHMNKEYKSEKLLIAYEPRWSIGTGIIPSDKEINQMSAFIMEISKKRIPHASIRLLYGGSINGQTVKNITKVKDLHGFLIGGASLDIQTLKKIVSYS